MTSLLFLTTFLYALLGASGTVPAYRDSGDLVASIHTLGIAHPPGYSLYILIGKVFVTLLPFGNVAYRVNVMSAFFAAATVAVLYGFLSKAEGDDNRWSALAASVVLASAPAFVSLARVAEMYTLSACLAAAILALLFSEHPKAPAGAALLLGLGLSVHPTLIFLLPLFLVRHRQTLQIHTLIYFLLGLSVFLYLPLRASQDPPLNWGDPSQWRNFWRVVTRADYGGLKLHPVQSTLAWTPSGLWQQSAYFLKSFQAQMGMIAITIGGWGVVSMFIKPSPKKIDIYRGLLASWILSGPVFVVLSNLPLQEPSTPAILEPYLLIPVVLWMPFIVLGCRWLSERLAGRGWVTLALLVVMVSFKPWGGASQREDFYAYDYARNLLRMLPPEAVLFDPDDPTHFTIQTLQKLEGRREDVTLLSFFRTRWGYEQIRKRSPELLPAFPIQSAQELEHILWTYSALKRPFYAELPVKFGPVPYRVEGLVYAAQRSAAARSTPESRSLAKASLAQMVQRGDFVATHHQDFFLRHLLDYYAAAHSNLGLEYAQAREWDAAVAEYEEALRINPAQSAAWNNLGSVAFQRGDYPSALAYFQQGLELEPHNEMLRKNAQITGQKMAKNL